ncbi:MAG TPA: asparagine synthase (glutamine-hydrolyzing), partial [Alphaproteobacteria bacterium]|nr:asparagine synthase (glutamine-hydrolyzing) [Alphaproteobacteria bacterium]
AFALWDRRERRLSLVRDAAGIKPLYWAEAGACVLFGSELKPLRCHPDFDATIDRDAVFSLLRHNYVKGPRTIHAGARKLAPGEVLEIEASGTRRSWRFRESWQSVRPDPAAGSGDPDALLDELEAVLADAVKRQMISDVPIGCFLSGGIDSSLMAALMQRQANAPVSTFTIGFHEPGFDEAEHAKAIAAHLGTRHTELYVDPVHCRETIPDLPGIYDEPFADMSQIPTLLLSRMTRRDVTVAISGDGGDEGFAGYARYQWALRFRRLRDRLGPGLSRTAAALMHAAPVPAWNALTGWRQPGPRLGERLHKIGYLLAGETPCRLYDHLLAQWDEPQGTALGGQDYDGYVTAARIHGEISDYQAFMQASDMAGYLPDGILTKVDRASMSVGLEARVPLLDDEVLAFLSRLPAGLCVAEGRGKVALRRLLCRHVPRELVDRPKHGFSVPMGAWLRGELRDWAEDLLSERRLREDGLLDPGAIRRLWRQHLAGQANYQYQLWGPLMLQAWLREQRVP